jgi:RNA polymerase sigma-70 factor (ECF subfamily)
MFLSMAAIDERRKCMVDERSREGRVPLDDPQLVRRFVAGCDRAAEEVFAASVPRLTRVIRRLLAWRDDPRDLLQDVFVAALRARSRFRGESSLETWLVRIAINECRKYHRRKWLETRLLRSLRFRSQPGEAGVAEERAVRNECAARVRGAFGRLPAIYREVLVLYYLEEMTAAAVANVLGIRRGTVEVRLSRARCELERMLDCRGERR